MFNVVKPQTFNLPKQKRTPVLRRAYRKLPFLGIFPEKYRHNESLNFKIFVDTWV